MSYIVVGRCEEKGECFFGIFVCGVVKGGDEVVICYDESVVSEEI